MAAKPINILLDVNYPLVLAEWEDSAQPTSGWAWLDGSDWSSVVHCQSVGWLVHDGEHVKALAQNFGNLGQEDGSQVSGVIRIPARCITKIIRLTERD